MILVYVCLVCKSVRIASRRKDVECLHCDQQMALSDLTFMEWTEMTEAEREAYGPIWDKREAERQRKWTKKKEIIARNKLENQDK